MVNESQLISQLMQEKNAAITERDLVLAIASKLATVCGLEAELWQHEEEEWEDEWRNIVAIYLPTGQVTWHIHDSELQYFQHLKPGVNKWDGHSTEEKYQRVKNFVTMVQTLTVTDNL